MSKAWSFIAGVFDRRGKDFKNSPDVEVDESLRERFMISKMKVCVVGLGQIGLPVAQYINNKGLEIWGYDINPKTVENAAKTEKFEATSSWEDIPKVDIYVICVTTGQVNESPDLSHVFDVCKRISEKAASTSLISIESTIIPGTCKKIFEETFDGRVRLVHAPHRYWADEPEKHGVNQLRVIGGVNSASLRAGLAFYQDLLNIPMHVCSTAEVAEMCKITENSHRYLQIAFAEELKMICDKIYINFDDLRAACNTKWNVAIPEARDGIGRHCLPKDIRYVTSLAPNILLTGAMEVDKEYRKWLTKQKK